MRGKCLLERASWFLDSGRWAVVVLAVVVLAVVGLVPVLVLSVLPVSVELKAAKRAVLFKDDDERPR